MHGLMENAVYGGRVDNMFDMRVLRTYLRQCFDDRTVPGKAGSPRKGGRKWEGLPFGNIPVSTRIQVRRGRGEGGGGGGAGVYVCVRLHAYG